MDLLVLPLRSESHQCNHNEIQSLNTYLSNAMEKSSITLIMRMYNRTSRAMSFIISSVNVCVRVNVHICLSVLILTFDVVIFLL